MTKQLTFDRLVTNRRADVTSAPVDIEHVYTNRDRYIDPLILGKNHLLESSYDREKCAAQDPLVSAVTWSYQERAAAKFPKFYETDELGAEEIVPELRQALEMVGYKDFSQVVKALAQIHGWAVMVVWTDDQGELDYYIFSEYQCPEGQWIRDRTHPNPRMRNRVIGWRVLSKEHLPLNRSTSTLTPFYETFMRDDPGVFYVTRGSEKGSKGFGYSRIEKVWDSLVKLREESHANALRARVFPISVVPADWKKPQIQSFFNAISKMDQTTALVSKAGKNPDGTMVPELPTFNWISPGTSASNKSAEGGSGAISDLSSEWARLCAGLMYNVAYFFGAGTVSASKAAGGVDQFDDQQTDIEEWNMLREFDIEFSTWLAEVAGIAVPDSFVIKCHWEWTRDEQMVAEAEAMEAEMEQGNEGNSTVKENISISEIYKIAQKNYTKSGALGFIDSSGVISMKTDDLLKSGVSMSDLQKFESSGQITFEGDRTTKTAKYFIAIKNQEYDYDEIENAVDPKYPTADFGLIGKTVDVIKGRWKSGRYGKPEEVPGQWTPVNSKSGNVKGVAFTPGTGPAGEDEINIEFDGGDIYTYTGTKGENMKDIATQVQREGGEAIWRELRGRPTTGYEAGKTPTGTSKKGGKPGVPLAGQAHKVSYDYTPGAGPSATAPKKKIIPSLFGMAKNQSLADLSRKQFKETIQAKFNHSFGNTSIDLIKQIIQFENEFAQEQVYRENSVEIGKPMDFTISLKYRDKRDPTKINEEFACKKDWREFLKNGYESDIRLYHGPTEVIGKAKWSWNEETDEPVLEPDLDREEIKQLMEKKGYTNRRLYQKLTKGEPLPLSTEYFARVEKINGKSYQRGLKGLSVVLVDQGNCPDDLCSLSPKEV